MFPGVDGFHWTFGHVFFISVFLCVATALAVVVIVSLARAGRDFLDGRSEAIRWAAEFSDLPRGDRTCRHALTGEAPDRICPNAFDCRTCADHPRFQEAQGGVAVARSDSDMLCGLSYPKHRYYHRGHTWVEEQPDGTLLVGLDAVALRMIGEPDAVKLPGAGCELEVNGEGWRMWKDGLEVRVLSPVEGTVLHTGPQDNWYLRVKPRSNPPDLQHLLRGEEVAAWVGRELERLQLAVSIDSGIPVLADGGVLVKDFLGELPVATRDVILGEMFLEA
jgi:glycine cleavage system H lipoate-binding protein